MGDSVQLGHEDQIEKCQALPGVPWAAEEARAVGVGLITLELPIGPSCSLQKDLGHKRQITNRA